DTEAMLRVIDRMMMMTTAATQREKEKGSGNDNLPAPHPTKNMLIHITKLLLKHKNSAKIYNLIDTLQAHNIAVPHEVWSALVICMLKNTEIELAYRTFQDQMISRSIVPTTECFERLVIGLSTIGEIREAYEFLCKAEGQGLVLGQKTYLLMLRMAAQELNEPKIVEDCFRKCVDVFSIEPTEGDLLWVLNTAARTGTPRLATEALKVLENKPGIEFKEQHLEPLLEAFIVDHDWAKMFEMLHHLRESGIGYGKGSLSLLSYELGRIRNRPLHSPAALFEMAMRMKDQYPLIVDATLLNALLRGLAIGKHVNLVFECAETWFKEAQVRRTIETYHVLLDCCRDSGNMKTAEVLFKALEKTDTHLAPDEKAYGLFAETCLKQKEYEDVFAILETMKMKGMIPSAQLYGKVARKCANERDPRAQLVLDEMKVYRYVVDDELVRFVETSGESAKRSEDRAKERQQRQRQEQLEGEMAISQNEFEEKINNEEDVWGYRDDNDDFADSEEFVASDDGKQKNAN
ncbi:hypothetical protein H4219_004564, partial [Mycoemilia scoparia]